MIKLLCVVFHVASIYTYRGEWSKSSLSFHSFNHLDNSKQKTRGFLRNLKNNPPKYFGNFEIDKKKSTKKDYTPILRNFFDVSNLPLFPFRKGPPL